MQEINLTVKVLKAQGIKGTKGDHVNTFVRVQFSDFDFLDSPIRLDTSTPDYNFEYSIPIQINEASIDAINNKSVQFTLFESLPKEKTAVLATGEVHTASFLVYPKTESLQNITTLAPELSFSRKIPLTYLNPKMLQSAGKNAAVEELPELEVNISISSLLIPTDVVQDGNFVTLKLDDVLPCPEEWSLREGSEKDLNTNLFTYTVNFVVPAAGGIDRLISISQGSLSISEAPAALENLVNIAQPIYGGKSIAQGATAMNQSGSVEEAACIDAPPAPISIPEKGNAEYASNNFKKVTWGNNRYTIWLPPDAVVRFREKLVSKQGIEVEFVRELQSRYAHVVDPHVNKYRGKALVDATCLLYPRVVGFRGRFSVEVHDAAQRPCTGANETSTTQIQSLTEPTKKIKGMKEEGSNLYKCIGTTLGIEFMLEKPLLIKKVLSAIKGSVTDYIPTRITPQHLLFKRRAAKAELEYQETIQDIVRKLVIEYQGVLRSIIAKTNSTSLGNEIFSDAADKSESLDNLLPLPFVPAQSAHQEQERKRDFLFYLNKSGAYFYFKEKLKAAVIEIVREKFRKKSVFPSKAELQLFMSQIYVYLTDEMHIAINKIFADADKISINPTTSNTLNVDALKVLADSGEAEGQVFAATGYHKERIAKYGEEHVSVWYDYASFCRRNGMNSMADECFKELLSVNPGDFNGVLAYGCISSEKEQFEKARQFIHAAVSIAPASVTARLTLALFYEILGEDDESERYMIETSALAKLNGSHNSMYMDAARTYAHIHAGQLCESAISHQLLQIPKSSPQELIAAYLLLSQLERQRGNQDKAMEHIQEALKIRQDDPAVWAALGYLYYSNAQWDKSQMSYETVLTLTQATSDMPTVYIRLGAIYMKHIEIKTPRYNNAETHSYLARQSKSMFLRACEEAPSCTSWLGAGRACVLLKEYTDAESALSEANVLNNRNAQVWAHLAYLCLLQNRSYEATQAISQAIKLGIRDIQVLRNVGVCFFELRDIASATKCFELALSLLHEQLEDSKNRQRSIHVNKQLQQRQKQKQFEIENFIQQTRKTDEDTGNRPEPDVEYAIEIDADTDIVAEMTSVKELISKTLHGYATLR